MAAVTASIVATIIDNVVKGQSERQHNAILLLNECLAEHHSAYLIFFIALATGASFTEYWGTGVVQIAILLSLAFYIKGVHSTTRHDRKIARDHICGPGCRAKLKRETVIWICGLNIVFALFMMALASYLAIITVRNPS